MIDFIKVVIYNKKLINRFFNHSLLIWSSQHEKLVGEEGVILSKKCFNYNGIEFLFSKNKLEILFRPHYYFNSNLHNANDFSIADCIAVIKEFQDTFSIDLRQFRIVNLEFGLNIQSPIDVKDLITWIKYHGRNEFRTHTGLSYSKISSSMRADGKDNTYKMIKAYAKSLQHPNYCQGEVFRFEVKSKRYAYIKKLGITSLEGLLNPQNYDGLIDELKREFKEVLIVDHNLDYSDLSVRDQKLLAKYLNSDKWFTYLNQARNGFRKHFNIYHELLGKCDTHLKKQLTALINDKCEELKIAEPVYTIQSIERGANSSISIGEYCTHHEDTEPEDNSYQEINKSSNNRISNYLLKLQDKINHNLIDLFKIKYETKE
jgi:hypothetical protein